MFIVGLPFPVHAHLPELELLTSSVEERLSMAGSVTMSPSHEHGSLLKDADQL